MVKQILEEPKLKVVNKPIKINTNPIDVQDVKIGIVGQTPLLMEKMSDRIRQQLVNIVTGKGKEKNKNRDLELEVKEKIHKDTKGNVGFPSGGFQKAIVEVAPYLDGMDKKKVKGGMMVIGDLDGGLVSIKFKKQVINKAIGRDSGINRAPREIWRPEFQEWSCTLHIRYNAAQITLDQIVNLIKLAGFHIGVGSWTPQHFGFFGTFTVK